MLFMHTIHILFVDACVPRLWCALQVNTSTVILVHANATASLACLDIIKIQKLVVV